MSHLRCVTDFHHLFYMANCQGGAIEPKIMIKIKIYRDLFFWSKKFGDLRSSYSDLFFKIFQEWKFFFFNFFFQNF